MATMELLFDLNLASHSPAFSNKKTDKDMYMYMYVAVYIFEGGNRLM